MNVTYATDVARRWFRWRCKYRPHVFRRLLDGDDHYWCCARCGLFEHRSLT